MRPGFQRKTLFDSKFHSRKLSKNVRSLIESCGGAGNINWHSRTRPKEVGPVLVPCRRHQMGGEVPRLIFKELPAEMFRRCGG